MAVIQVSELHDGRGGSSALQKNKGVRKHTRVFRVVTDSPFDTSYDIFSVLPSLGSVHPRDPRAYCTDKSLTNEGFSKCVWKATLSYSTERELTENPLEAPAAIEWNSSATQCGFTLDSDGNPILNSAGDFFAEGVKGEKSFWTVNITKNVAIVPSWILTYADAVNSGAVTVDGVSVPAKYAKVSSIKISKTLNSNDIAYRELQIGLKLNPDKWTRRMIDQGLRYTFTDDDGNVVKTPCFDRSLAIARKPELLDGEGGMLWIALGDEEYEPGDEKYLSYDIYPLKDFSSLPLA